MSEIKTLSETPVTMAELSDELSKIKKRDGELNFRANKTDEYLSQFGKLNPKKTKELQEKIQKMAIPRIKETHICKIVDLMPTNVESLKVILQAYMVTITNDNLKKIVDVVKEYE
jgi:DNA-directed RNA polymerase subunit F